MMEHYADDSNLAEILRESDKVLAGLSGQREMTNSELLEQAKRFAATAASYTGTETKPKKHFVERKAAAVKNKIGMHMDMLRNTATNISHLRERISGSGDKKLVAPYGREIAKPEIADRKLSEYNEKIDSTLKYLSTKTKGNSKIEDKITRYRDIIEGVRGDLKELPNAVKEGRVKKPAAFDQKFEQKLEKKAEGVMSRMNYQPTSGTKTPFSEYPSDDDEEAVGDWIKYEGFNSQEDLDTFNKMLNEFMEKDFPRLRYEEPDLQNKGKGRNQTDGPSRHRKVRNPFSQDYQPDDEYLKKRSDDAERQLRDILSQKNMGDSSRGSQPVSEKQFLDNYLAKKLRETVQPVSTDVHKSEKKKTSRPVTKSKQEQTRRSTEKKLPSDGNQSTFEPSPVTKNLKKSEKRPQVFEPSGSSSIETQNLDLSGFDIPRPNIPEGATKQDMERLKKLIMKERQEQLRKKREDWERNNELSDERIERQESKELKCEAARPSIFNFPLPNMKPKGTDFVTDHERHEKMFQNAMTGIEGFGKKENLEYEFAVNPFYEKSKSDSDSARSPIKLKGYGGVRKKNAI